MDKRKHTFVISAFPGCGKSYCFNNFQDKLVILDSDSSEFSWVKDENNNNTKERNPNFPSNYIQHIRDNIGKVDIIFVSSHEVVRNALRENNIKSLIVYPGKDMKEEWLRRFKERGNNEAFIKFISDNWDKFIDKIELDGEDKFFLIQRLSDTNPYIDLNFLYSLLDNSMGNLTCLWSN